MQVCSRLTMGDDGLITTIHHRESGHARPDQVPCNEFRVMPFEIIRMARIHGSGAHDGHLTQQHIDQLWQFRQYRCPSAALRDPETIGIELPTEPADAWLGADGSFAAEEPGNDPDHRDEPTEQEQDAEQGQGDVSAAFDQMPCHESRPLGVRLYE